jgi:hypothetical protein
MKHVLASASSSEAADAADAAISDQYALFSERDPSDVSVRGRGREGSLCLRCRCLTDLGIPTGSNHLTSRIDFLPISAVIEKVHRTFFATLGPPAPHAHTPCGM